MGFPLLDECLGQLAIEAAADVGGPSAPLVLSGWTETRRLNVSRAYTEYLTDSPVFALGVCKTWIAGLDTSVTFIADCRWPVRDE